ncbi:hypothetical protein [Sedimentibacter sp. B4]|uniref:hypothetical protein n=1 Tax=Sedimentibacter sp. B4 TaxID=304766 RepID=UPI0002DBBBDC|nr:hypothetical protein [Sedimentibacter sp. B4]
MKVILWDSDFTEIAWERKCEELDIDIRSRAIIFDDIDEYEVSNRISGEIYGAPWSYDNHYRQVYLDEKWNEYMHFEEISENDERANNKKYKWEIVFVEKNKRWRGMAISTNYNLRRTLRDDESFSVCIKREVKKYEDIEQIMFELKDIMRKKTIVSGNDKMLALNKLEFEKILNMYKNIMGNNKMVSDELYRKEEAFINILFN